MKKFTTELSSKKQQYGDLVVTVHDKYGNLLQKVEQPVDSFNEQWWKVLQYSMAGVGTTPLTRLDGSSVTTSLAGPSIYCFDSFINSYSGILCGSGTNPTTIQKNTFDTLIQHGMGNGQLEAQIATVEYDTSTTIATLTRPFVNRSANQANITVNEVGLNGSGSVQSGIGGFLFVRDVLLSSIVIPYEALMTVQYKVRVFSGNNNFKNIFIRPFGLSATAGGGTATSNITNTTNVSREIQSASSRIFASEGMTNRGLVLGTSNGAFVVTQNNLLSPIAHGNSAGQLFYHSQTNSTFDTNTATNSCRSLFHRSFENRSGSNIEVREIGVFTDQQQGGVQSFMLDRRVIEPPVTITNGNIVSFSWEFCYTV
jgi:hypothetical protein